MKQYLFVISMFFATTGLALAADNFINYLEARVYTDQAYRFLFEDRSPEAGDTVNAAGFVMMDEAELQTFIDAFGHAKYGEIFSYYCTVSGTLEAYEGTYVEREIPYQIDITVGASSFDISNMIEARKALVGKDDKINQNKQITDKLKNVSLITISKLTASRIKRLRRDNLYEILNSGRSAESELLTLNIKNLFSVYDDQGSRVKHVKYKTCGSQKTEVEGFKMESKYPSLIESIEVKRD